MSAADEKRPPLHEATLRLLSLLATSQMEKDLLQKGIEALAAVLQARYGAIGLVDDAGKLRQFVYTGIGPEEAARIGKLPEGRGLLGVTTPLRLTDMSREPRSVGFPPNHPPMKSLLSVTFSHEGHHYGRVYLSEKLDGSDFGKEDEQLLSHFASVFAMMLAFHRAQIERERSAEALLEISHALSAITGEPFFRELVMNVTKVLGVAYAFVGEVTDASRRAIRTVAVCADGKLADNFIYDLPGTPCENVIDKKICSYEHGVQQMFPDDRMLAEMGIESYLGGPLLDSAGKALGILVLLDRKPLADPQYAQAILKICAARAAAEMERLRSERALRDNEQRFRQLAENIREVFWMTDPSKNQMLYVSPAYEKIWGRSCASLYENPTAWLEAIHPEDRERVRHAALMKQTSDEYDEEYRIVRPDGTQRWIRDRAFPIRDASGKMYRVTGIAEDITERKQAETETRKLSSVVEQTADIVVITDRDGIIQYVNPAYETITGYTRAEALGKKTSIVKSDKHDKEFYKRLWSIILRGEVFRERLINRKKDGTLYHEEKTITPLKNARGEITHFVSTGKDITRRVEAENENSRMQSFLDSVVENLPNMVVVKDASELRFVRFNRAAEELLGYSRHDMLGKNDHDFFPKEEADFFTAKDREVLRSGQLHDIPEEPIHTLHRGVRILHTRKIPIRDGDGNPLYLLGISEDITERKQAERKLRENNEILERIFDSTHFCLAYLDRDFNFIRVNQAYAKACGYPPEHFPGKNHFQLYPHEENEAIFRGVVQTGESFTAMAKPFEFPDHPEWGVTYWDWTLHPLKDAAGKVEALLFVLLDVTERRRTEEQLNTLAYYDVLTGLPNRQQVNDSLYRAMLEAESRERLVAVMFLDLDRFKNINDTLGHDVGDALLKEVAVRLKASLRPGDSISRLGGDEFILILGNIAHINDVTRVAQKILDQFIPPFRIAGRDLFISPSVGITLYPFDDNNAENLLKNADIAMYRAKELGRNNFQFYTPELNVRAARRMELETGLRRALEKEEFILHYQPLVNMQTGKITGMEALLRWRHPEYGLIPPMDFIPLAEETGLIVPIGEWVLRTACAQIKNWHATGFPAMHVAVNLSSVQLQQKNFAEVVKRALRETGLEPQYLDLELTESLLMHDMEVVEKILKELKALGVLFSLDDFGTGYSSLSYLKRFPIDFLKIDRSFVNDINQDRYGAGIVYAIIVMAHTLGIKVIAEGVETAAQLEFLRAQGCDITQGYFCSEPLAVETFTELLKDWQEIRMGKCSINKPVRKLRKKQIRHSRRPRP